MWGQFQIFSHPSYCGVYIMCIVIYCDQVSAMSVYAMSMIQLQAYEQVCDNAVGSGPIHHDLEMENKQLHADVLHLKVHQLYHLFLVHL